jgi:hypothetical protein
MRYIVLDEGAHEPFILGAILDPDFAADGGLPGESLTRAAVRRRYPDALAAWDRGDCSAYSAWRIVQEAEMEVDFAADRAAE